MQKYLLTDEDVAAITATDDVLVIQTIEVHIFNLQVVATISLQAVHFGRISRVRLTVCTLQ